MRYSAALYGILRVSNKKSLTKEAGPPSFPLAIASGPEGDIWRELHRLQDVDVARQHSGSPFCDLPVLRSHQQVLQ